MAAILINSTFETMLFPALPAIRADLGLSVARGAWIFTAFMLMAAVSLPLLGRLADLYGSHRTFVGVLTLVTLGVLLPVAGHSFTLFVIGQSLVGLQMALIPLGVAVLRETPQGKSDVRTAGLMTAAAVSTAAGLLVAGVVLEFATYRVVYWGAFILDLALLCLAVTALRRDVSVPSRGGASAVDWLGAASLGAALLALLIAITLAAHLSWVSGPVLSWGAASAVAAALWIWRSLMARQPLIELSLLRLPSVNRAAIIQLSFGFGTIATFLVVPLIVQAPVAAGGMGSSPSAAAYALAPFGICSIIAPLLVATVRRATSAATVLIIGSAFSIAGPALPLFTHDFAMVITATGCLGLGVGFVVTQTFDLVGSTVPADRVASFSSLVYVLKMIGAALGSQAAMSLIGRLSNAPRFAHALELAAAAMAISAVAASTLLRSPMARPATDRRDGP